MNRSIHKDIKIRKINGVSEFKVYHIISNKTIKVFKSRAEAYFFARKLNYQDVMQYN